jgi:hypothetical protein
LSIDPTNVQEKFRITVSGANGSKYNIKFINPRYDPDNRNSVQVWTTRELTDNDSAARVRQQIVRYFYSIWGSNISVEKQGYNADDIETDDSELTVKTVYTISVLKQINGPSFSMASVVMADNGSSSVSIEAPFQDSTPPISGRFNIVCPNDDGSEFRTRDLSWADWT